VGGRPVPLFLGKRVGPLRNSDLPPTTTQSRLNRMYTGASIICTLYSTHYFTLSHTIVHPMCKQELNSSVTSCDGAKERQRHDCLN
jgi:hypothetical protein